MKAKERMQATMDGNEAVAHVAYRINEVCAIYPITPSSTMAELADEWSAKKIKNIWGQVPDVIEMQSEGGAAGTLHGSLQTGALTTTFTASQGLLLMLPNMYKIAGELTAAVFHVAARSLAAQGLSIFGDHGDVMAARMTGFGMISSANVQEAHDFALISQAVSLESRIPFIHFFDGFRTSHEVNKLEILSEEDLRTMIHEDLVIRHRQRGLNPEKPFIRGTAQNPDVYFQGRETVNRFYSDTPDIMEKTMARFDELTGRSYHLFQYTGHPEAERIIVVMGSAGDTIRETVLHLNAAGEKLGVIQVRLYRPFSMEHLLNALPASCRSLAVLDRTKEPGASGEPLYNDVVVALNEAYASEKIGRLPKTIGGRYGLSSKEFTPAMVKAVFDELTKSNPKNHFTIGIRDDVSHTSLDYDETFTLDESSWSQALFFGLGADGTVGANKNTIKIIGENTDLFAQGYFVYDSKKSGAKTVSHLRFGPKPIFAPYLIRQADFIACHQFNFLEKDDLLKYARQGASLLLNAPFPTEQVWDRLPRLVQVKAREKEMKIFVIDANRVALETGMAGRINTIMQTCFFALSGVLPREEAIQHIKKAIEKTYSKKGAKTIQKNFEAVDQSLSNLFELKIPARDTGTKTAEEVFSLTDEAPEFVRQVTARMMMGLGDELPVSLMPVDGTFPSGTTKWEKRNIAESIPLWRDDLCIQCGNCSFVCPHSVIRSKFYHRGFLEDQPEHFQSAPINAKGFPDTRFTLQIYSEDCTGCSLCVQVCPAHDPKDQSVKAINMKPRRERLDMDRDRENIAFFEALPENDRTKFNFSTVHGVQFLEPLFEFSGACAGCGETPYIKLITQLFGDRLVVANATGCSSIYGGNLPTTPWTTNKEGKGPAWSNSLFEDNAEFGLGMRISLDKQGEMARDLLWKMKDVVGVERVQSILDNKQSNDTEIQTQRRLVAELKKILQGMNSREAIQLGSVADHLIKHSVWLIGGDGWAYDIGSGGLDHVLSTGKDVNIIVLDTEVYSNTGGQMSKATPTAASAKFAAAGKRVGKKDLAMQAISYGNVYVAQIAMGANPQQTLLALREAEAYPGPSLILAYSHCIAHGIDMEKGLNQQKNAVQSGYWPLIRYNPMLRKADQNPFILDSLRPSMSLKDYAYQELRYKVLTKSNPVEAEHLMQLAQEIVDLRWRNYEEMAGFSAKDFQPVH
ncbi:MAG TPA: pyruvate:ferredoxin (flavodoxin) oxidoreductase [Saprospiraceae bacterium]|nr:pyruvate:ferredoxin (flavodoxin) oxidoreductase [Saprospiraceae bacterium]